MARQIGRVKASDAAAAVARALAAHRRLEGRVESVRRLKSDMGSGLSPKVQQVHPPKFNKCICSSWFRTTFACGYIFTLCN